MTRAWWIETGAQVLRELQAGTLMLAIGLLAGYIKGRWDKKQEGE